jgi:rRNA-processing protein FCF1
MKIVLDTNFMNIPFNYGVDVFEQLLGFDLYTLKECVDELMRVNPGAVELMNSKGVKVVTETFKSRTVDDRIIDFAAENRMYLATVDKGLLSKAQKKKIPCLTLRQGKYLMRV